MAENKGGCFCGNLRLSFKGEPAGRALCHCLDCRKIGGAAFSDNIIVDDSNFKLESGTPKEISKIADSGKKITSHFCPDCGTTVYRTGESFPNQHLIKSGVLDDPEWASKSVPKAELFAPERLSWLPELKDAAQLPKMPGQ